jgi:hypothetical protein
MLSNEKPENFKNESSFLKQSSIQMNSQNSNCEEQVTTEMELHNATTAAFLGTNDQNNLPQSNNSSHSESQVTNNSSDLQKTLARDNLKNGFILVIQSLQNKIFSKTHVSKLITKISENYPEELMAFHKKNDHTLSKNIIENQMKEAEELRKKRSSDLHDSLIANKETIATLAAALLKSKDLEIQGRFSSADAFYLPDKSSY